MKADKLWRETNRELCQFMRKVGSKEYELIHINLWNEAADLYGVGRAVVNLDNYGEEEITDAICWYGYLDMDEVFEERGESAAKRFFARCIFELMPISDMETLFTGSEKDCKAFILDCVKSDGVMRKKAQAVNL